MTTSGAPPELESPLGEATPVIKAEPLGPPATINRRSSRRNFFKGAAAVAAGSLGASVVARQLGGVRNPTPIPAIPDGVTVVPGTLDPDTTWGTPEIRLARRITNGVTPEEAQLAKSLGFSGYLDYHLNYSAIDDTAAAAFVATTYPQLVMDGTALSALTANVVEQQLQQATLFRAAFSKRQLFERMVEFWTDHFNISMQKVGYLKTLDDRDVIRKYALSTFPEILKASAHSSAMLVYLDNNTSRYPRVNQNYARELMELHTLGVDGGYTQTDVDEVARCLSGWTIQGRGNFFFDPTGHDYGSKTFLGNTIAAAPGTGAAGIADGDKVLDVLIHHPSTAKFIATKMIKWLLRYDPPDAFVTDVAAVYTQTTGNIPAMIRAILTPLSLPAAPGKHKRPYHFVISALRAANPTVTGMVGISNTRLPLVGQQPFTWETPDGFPDKVQYWAGSVMQRWNFGDYLTALASGEVIVNVAPLMTVNTPDGIIAAIGNAAFGGQMPADTRDHVKAYLAASAITTTRVRESLALAINSANFQWY